MSYASGIGNLQSGIESIAPSESRAAEPARQTSNFSQQSPIVSTSPIDQTNLSSIGGQVAEALNGSDTRSDKIASLQQAIAAGTYDVSSSDVAAKLVQSLLD